MSSPEESPPPVAAQILINNVYLNTTIFDSLITGICITAFLGTTYLYVISTRQRNHYVFATLVLLNAIVCTNFFLIWQLTSAAYIANGETRLSTFIFNGFGEPNVQMVQTVLRYAGFAVADGLLLWRCYNMATGITWSMWLLYFLFFVEFASFICRLTFTAIGDLHGGNNASVAELAHAINILDICTPLFTGATSVLGSCKICHKILTSVEQGMPSGARFKKIVYIIVQAAILYTGSLVLLEIFFIVYLTTGNPASYQAMVYTNMVTMAISALAPTLMVGQLMISSCGVTSAQDASTLKFYNPTTVTHTYSQQTSHQPLGITEKAVV